MSGPCSVIDVRADCVNANYGHCTSPTVRAFDLLQHRGLTDLPPEGSGGAAAAEARQLLPAASGHLNLQLLNQDVFPASGSLLTGRTASSTPTKLQRSPNRNSRLMDVSVDRYHPAKDPCPRFGRYLIAMLSYDRITP